MGKTSAVNLTIDSLKKIDQRTHVVRFDPWTYSGQENLTRAFFKVLEANVEKKLGQEVADGIRNVARFFAGVAVPVGKALGSVAPIIDAAGAGGIATASSKALESLPTKLLKDKTLEQARAHLFKLLSNMPNRLLIVIDDIDRLLADEIRQMLSMVKSLADLPNTTYVLVFDRTIVDAAMDQNSSDKQPRFLEKIVHVPLDLPPATKNGIRAMFAERLGAICGDVINREDSSWWLIIDIALAEYLRSPRDVVRLSNALAIVWPGVANEVFIADLVGIEMIRCFEPEAYRVICSSRDFLVGRGGPFREDAGEKLAAILLESFSPQRKSRAAELLTSLFPRMRAFNAFGDFHFPTSRGDSIESGRRISDPEGTDAYFRFEPPEEELSVMDIRSLRKSLEVEVDIKAFFERMRHRKHAGGSSFVGDTLDAIAAILRENPDIDTEPLIGHLFRNCDGILLKSDPASEEAFPVDNRYRMHQLMPRVVLGVRSNRRFKVLNTAFSKEDTSISAELYLVELLGAEHGLFTEDPEVCSEPLLKMQEVKALAQKFLKNVRRHARSGSLKTKPQVPRILRLWNTLTVGPEVKNWVSSTLRANSSFAVQLAFQNMGRVHSSAAPYVYRAMNHLLDPDIYDLKVFKQSLSKATVSNAEDRRDLKKFVEILGEQQKQVTQE
jgi:hypothetical protein